MHHVHNTCIDSILFTNESHHEHARTLISRTCGTSPTQIDKMASQKKMTKWSRPPNQRLSTPFDSTLQTTCHPRSRHTERPGCEVKSSMSIARVGCGNFAWSMGTNPSNLVNTDTRAKKKKKLCANISVRVAIRLCGCFAARMRSPETVSNHFPPLHSHRTSTLRNVRTSRTGAVLRVPHVHAQLNLTHGVCSSIPCGCHKSSLFQV